VTLYSVPIESLAAPADTASLATQLDRRVARLTQLLRHKAHTHSSVGALLTLRRLDDEGPMRITELATAELVAQPTMTVLVRRLEQDGLVRRTPDPDDARAVRVALTDAGRDELAAVRSRRAAILEARLEQLDADQRAALAAALPAFDDLLSLEQTT
jgi:DNA-binding MarR family transcriptional regulator